VHGNPVSLTNGGMAGLGRGGSQHPSTTSNGHAFRQGDFGGHGKSQFHNRSFRECRLGVKENSAATQVLSKSRHSPSLEMNRQWQVHFETLRASSFQMIFKTIRICAHREYFHSCRIQFSDQRSLTLSRIGLGGKFQMPSPLDAIPCRRPQDVKKF
jgi:hypothetical protein